MKSNFLIPISELLIQCNADSCCEHITGGVNIYLYVLCVFDCVWVCNSNLEYQQKNISHARPQQN